LLCRGRLSPSTARVRMTTVTAKEYLLQAVGYL
jgi:hypothetical protein